MKQLLLTTIAAVVVVGCGESQQSPEPPTAKDLTANQRAHFMQAKLDEAILKGKIEAIKQHLADGADVNAKEDDGSTPLFYAMAVGRTMQGTVLKEIVELLIAESANVNAKRDDGYTPLHAAVVGLQGWGEDGDQGWEIFELLIENGAEVNAKIETGKLKGRTPLDMAVDAARSGIESRGGIHEFLRKHGCKKSYELEAAEPVAEDAQPEPPTAKARDISIYEAAWKGNIEAVKQHLAAGTEVDAKDKRGRTPLHWAALGHKEVAELLIAKGADVNVKDIVGSTPLHFAADEGHKEIAELLIAKGADVNTRGFARMTPLDEAARESPRNSPEVKAAKKETADLLRKHGGKTGEELKAEGK